MERTSHFRTEPPEVRVVAVIDIGATSVRMMIAEIREGGVTNELESLSQAVQLGRDSFLHGEISRATIEDCVHVMKVYQQKLREYGIDHPDDIRVVATSAVREADNRLAFADRIYIATGLAIEPFDEASLHRTTFIGIKPILDTYPQLNQGQTIVCEVGGGTTEILVMEDGSVSFANTYRLGALRLIKTLEALQTPLASSDRLIESQIEKTGNQVIGAIQEADVRHLVVMGGEMRLAASQITGNSQGAVLVPIGIKEFSEFTRQTLAATPDLLVKKYHLSVSESQSLAPALLVNLHLAKRLGVESLHVANVNLREGLVKDFLSGDDVIGQADQQIVAGAMTFGRRFGFDEPHACHVDQLATQLFAQTTELHQLNQRWLLLLRMSAILHEVGRAISERSYHKHSMYIIRNANFFGLSSRDLALVGLVARYHRRALPQLRHEVYSQLKRDDRASVSKLSAILRVAKSLDASRSQRVKEIESEVSGNVMRIYVPGMTDLSLEQLELRRERVFFENIFGIKPELTSVPSESISERKSD